MVLLGELCAKELRKYNTDIFFSQQITFLTGILSSKKGPGKTWWDAQEPLSRAVGTKAGACRLADAALVALTAQRTGHNGSRPQGQPQALGSSKLLIPGATKKKY